MASLDFTSPNYYLKQIYTSCLAEACYYIESNKEACIVDPLRDPFVYTKLAQERGATIKYIFLTHFHADFISGHVDLERITNAMIVYGPTAEAHGVNLKVAKDGEEIPVGKIRIVVLHTPGHTMESSSFLLVDNGKPLYIMTGDCVFLGEVGRPDLAVKGATLTKEDLAGHLYDSIHNKIMVLPDDIVILPGHGAGSPCGKAIQAGTHDTLGNQKKTNYALQIKSRDEFIKIMCDNLPTPPQYFFHAAGMNKKNVPSCEQLIKKNKIPLTPDQFQSFMDQGYVAVDARFKNDFIKGWVPGSINNDLVNMFFGLYCGKLFPPTSKFVFIVEPGKEEDIIIRLSRIGYDDVAGYLDGGIDAWKKAGKQVWSANLCTAEEFKKAFETQKGLTVIDVRNVGERVNGYIPDSICQSVDDMETYLKNKTSKIPTGKQLYVHCRSGARATTAVSFLKKYGFNDIINIDGGIMALQKIDFPLNFAKCAKSGI